MYIYYPSCNFQKLFPDTAARIRDYLSTQPDVRIAGCCHLTHDLPGPGDTIVTICMSCMRGLDEIRPNIPGISLFELLLTRSDFVWPDQSGEAVTLQDCFRARGKQELHKAVRECLRRMNMSVAELPENRDAADFDGSFLLHAPYPQNVREAPRYFGEYLPGHLIPLPEEAYPEYFRERAARFGSGRVVCYCNTCTTALRQGGARAEHLAELLFPGAGN